jgi:hypothetical protein
VHVTAPQSGIAQRTYLEALTKWLLQFSPADDAASDFYEGFMDECETFEADAQTSKVMEPWNGALDNPACFSQSTAVRLAASGDLGHDAGCV